MTDLISQDPPPSLHDLADVSGDWLARNALNLPPGLPPLQWLGIGEFVEYLADWPPLARGDWWNYGVAEYGEEKVAEFLEWVQQNYPDSPLCRKAKTYSNYGRVCREFPVDPIPGEREYDNYWWYEAAAGIPETERAEFLEVCAEHNLTAHQARHLAHGPDDDYSDEQVAEIKARDRRLREQSRNLSITVDHLREELDEERARVESLEAERDRARGAVCPHCGVVIEWEAME